MRTKYLIWLILSCCITSPVLSQTCPPNIGFENGTLNNWQCSAGSIARDGFLSLGSTGPVNGRHTIFANTYPQALDPYGNFPVNCPNGSGYSVRLGNSSAGGEAEGMSYTFTIPPTQNDYSLIYNYAVVFENPAHQPFEQPRFTSKVFSVTDNAYISCGSFDFVASSNLPGFQNAGGDIFFKPWSPVTVNLTGYAGKTVRLEFTTNDCAFTRHFGYAYLDVNEDCSSSPIAGTTYCTGATSLKLTAPYGFAIYNWYNADFSQLLGTSNILTIAPPPPANTTYAVEIIPYQGLGCLDTLFATIHVSTDPFALNVLDSISGCPSGVDLTAPPITAGSTPGLVFTYFTDPNEINYLPTPKEVTLNGTYFIRGVNSAGCNDIKPISVVILPPPNIVITDPEGVCSPQQIDITKAAVTAGSDAGLAFTYWVDSKATIPLTNPKAVAAAGVYYIKGVGITSCSSIKPVNVKIGSIPNVVIHNPIGCGVVDLTNPQITAGSTSGITYTFWADATASISLINAKAITNSGTYFIKATHVSGCSIIRPVSVTINPNPVFRVKDPLPVKFPVTIVDITTAVTPDNTITFSYWLDSTTRKRVTNPEAVDKRGTYFVKGTNAFGCSIVKPINVVIVPSTEPVIYAPNAFTPNNDGLNDLFKIKALGELTIHHFKIFNRWGQVIYNTSDISNSWNGKFTGIDQPIGTYVWFLDGYDEYYKKIFKKNGAVTLVR